MKVINARSLVITNRKWYLTANSEFTYTYLERTVKNRAVKDEIVQQLNKRNIETNVFFKELNMKGKINKVNSYIIASPSKQFFSIFSSIDAKNSSLNLNPTIPEAIPEIQEEA
ncbi:MAG: hypothetical protein ACK4OM_02130 [Alphaproteobacteria bacterium]